MAEILKPPEKLKIQIRDISEIPGATKGIWVTLEKIGPADAPDLGKKLEGPLREHEGAPACI